MSVHYKFKSALDFDTVTFDGLNISVGDLKRAIVHQKRLGKVTDFDLQITNAQTKEEYQDDTVLIPKNTSLIIARIPISQPKKSWNPQNSEKLQTTRTSSRADGTSLDLSKMKGSEEDKILEMMIQSTADYDPKSYHRLRGHSQVGEVPPTYRCNRCKKSGHWIKNCPFTLGKEHMEVKRNTGIPRSFLEKDDKEGAASFPEPAPTLDDKKEIPEDLVCSICKDLFVDAVMIPCCGSSFCDDCVRTALLESEDNECPDCKEKGCSPGSLIPNRFLRNSVNAFKNENGYTTTTKIKKVVEKEEKVETVGGSSSVKVKPDTTDLEPLDEKPTPADDIPLKDQDKCKPDEKSIEVNSVDSNPKIESAKVDEVESDYEDNITIMMPPVSLKSSSGASSDQSYSGRNVSHPKPPGIENSPHRTMQVPSLDMPKDNHSALDSQKNDWEHEHKSERDYSEEDSNGNLYYKNSCPKPHNPPINTQLHFANKMQIRPPRPNHILDVYSGPPNRVNTYQQIPPHLPLVQDPSVQGPSMMPFVNVYNQMGPRPNVGYQHTVRPIFHNPTSGFPPMRCPPAELLHANSNLASVYQGVAAKVGTGIIEDPLETFNRLMKEKERRREERRRSMERRRSWSHERQVRSRNHNSPYRRTGRELKEKPRIHESDRKRENVFDRNKPMRRRRSNSFSDRSSRSRSWSNSSPKKRSRSPYSKRSRSRTNMFIEKRDVGKNHGMRNDDELRKESPPAGLRRSTSEERSRILRHNHPDWYSHQAHPIGSFDSYRYQKRERFQESLPETLEPPPPGYETNQGSYSSNYVAQPIKRVNAQDGKERKPIEGSRILEKSEPKVSNKIAERKRRSSRSKSPLSRKQTSNADRLEKRTGKRSRIQSSSQRSSDRSKEEEHKKIEVISSETKRHHEKTTEKSGAKPRNDSKEKEIHRDRSEKPIFTEQAETPERTSTNNIVVSKDNEMKPGSKQEDKTLKKLKDKDRKKKRKDKSERKKVKKDKKGKRDREKQKTLTEKYDQRQNEEVDISRTPEINSYENSAVIEQLISNQENKEEIDLPPTSEVSTSKIDSENVLVKPKTDPATEADFKRVDSVLDIHDYEMEFDEMSTQNQKSKLIAPIPELSKWELDEQNNSASQVVKADSAEKSIYLDKDVNNEKVTNEVLRKAENAIFARAIKAIYPIEKTESKVEHHPRIYNETLPRISSKDNIKNFEITIPVSNSQERSVQIKDSNKKKSQSPKIIKSVKERLGSKITNKSSSSPNRDIGSKQHLRTHSISRNVGEREEERTRIKPKDRERDKNYRHATLSVRDRNRERDWEREKDQERERDREKEREREREKERERERYREKERERVRNRDRERDTERGRERDHERDGGRERDQDRFRERDRDRNRERDNDYKTAKLPSRDGEMYGRNRPYFKERVEGNSLTRTIRNNKETTTDSHNKDQIRLKKRSHEDLRQINESDAERERSKQRNNQNNCSSSKERNADECEDLKSDFMEKESNLKSHIASTCSSSGTANSSSDSESDDAKRKRKHKCKKDKKHSKRSLSADSRDSSKERHVKNKKRNKSSKKKKKNKK